MPFTVYRMFGFLVIGMISGAVPGLVSAQQSGPIQTSLRQFGIPFRMEMDGVSDPPKMVELLYSSDQGNSWKVYGKTGPETGKIDFRAPGEGEYWFAFRTTAVSGQVRQPNLAGPVLRVIVGKGGVDAASKRAAADSPVDVREKPLTNTDRSTLFPPDTGNASRAGNSSRFSDSRWTAASHADRHSGRTTRNGPVTPPKPPRSANKSRKSDQEGTPEEKTEEKTATLPDRSVAANTALADTTPAGMVRRETNDFIPKPVAFSESPVISEAPSLDSLFVDIGKLYGTPPGMEPLSSSEDQAITPEQPRKTGGSKTGAGEIGAGEIGAGEIGGSENGVRAVDGNAGAGSPFDTVSHESQPVLKKEVPANKPSLVFEPPDKYGTSVSAEKNASSAVPSSTVPSRTVPSRTVPSQVSPTPSAQPDSPLKQPGGDKTSSAPGVSPGISEVKPAKQPVPALPGRITKIELRGEDKNPLKKKVVVRWAVPGRAAPVATPAVSIRVDILRGFSAEGPWEPLVVGLENTGEHWWFVSEVDFTPFFIAVRTQGTDGRFTFDTTRTPIKIGPEMLAH